MRNGTTGKEVLDKLYLCKLLMDKLYEDIQKEADAIAEGHSSIKHSNEYFNRMTQQMKIII